METMSGSYVVKVDKLGPFSRGTVVAEKDLADQVERLMRKGWIRPATEDEIDSGVVHFEEDRSAAARSLEAQLREVNERNRLLESENTELKAQLAEYRRGGAEKASPKGAKGSEGVSGASGGGEGAAGYDLSILAGNLSDLEEYATATDDAAELHALLAGEKAKGDGARKTAVAMLEARIAVVEAK